MSERSREELRENVSEVVRKGELTADKKGKFNSSRLTEADQVYSLIWIRKLGPAL